MPTEEIEGVLRTVQNDVDLVVQVRTPSGWARLDGSSVADPDRFALEAGGEVVARISLGWDSRRARRYLVVTEAVVNIVKHAGASRVRVKIAARDEDLAVEITDDGIGGMPSDAPLPALRDRVLSVGGTLAVNSPPGAGTTIMAML
ncbi:ATP-binding protein [uncultured Friedmanniella sp.]|uniref:ATP-binding protein n=1 Tax=uncultured Friedmanniella sp. TaxID=335381 RepID=UPI0035C9FD46